MFEHDSYSFNVVETAPSGYVIGTISARDLDSGRYGTSGVRYSLSGAGAELFKVNGKTGVISVAECIPPAAVADHKRRKRQATHSPASTKRVNLTIAGETGVIDVNGAAIDDSVEPTTEMHFPPRSTGDDFSYHPFYSTDLDYIVMSDSGEGATTSSGHEHDSTLSADALQRDTFGGPAAALNSAHQTSAPSGGPGHAPCLDYETQNVYFLSYKVNTRCGKQSENATQRGFCFHFHNDRHQMITVSAKLRWFRSGFLYLTQTTRRRSARARSTGRRSTREPCYSIRL